jgi:steroid delta-isomerase-like uncharacterized protein
LSDGTFTRDAVLRYLAALNAHDPDAVSRCVTDDFHNEHTSARATGLRGRQAYRERLPHFLATFTDLQYEVEDLLVDGDRAAVPYRMTCRWTGDGGAPIPVTIRGIFWFRVDGDQIAHRVDYWDGEEFRRQVSPEQSQC